MRNTSLFVGLLFVVIGVVLDIRPANCGRHDVGRKQSKSTPEDDVVHQTNGTENGTVHHTRKHQKEVERLSVNGRGRQSRRRSVIEINGPGCDVVSCDVDEVCVSKRSSGRQSTTSCVDSKSAAQLRLTRGGRGKRRDSGENAAAHETHSQWQLEEKVKRMKADAHEFEMRQEKKQQRRLHWALAKTTKYPHVLDMQNDATDKTPPECHRRDLDVVGEHLLDQFKEQQDDHNSRRKKEKRNSTKKELHEDDECICQSPVSWQFQRLDANADGQLTSEETDTIVANKNDIIEPHCLAAFIRACDHNTDSALSEKEWCCCFADVLPPCLAAMKMVPSILVGGVPSVLPGAVVPQCDDDGFYKAVQCDSNTGHCWCADRNGIKLNSTTADGVNC